MADSQQIQEQSIPDGIDTDIGGGLATANGSTMANSSIMADPDERAIKPAGSRMQQEDDDQYEETQLNPDGFFADTNSQAACSVRVALRVRPLIRKEAHEREIVKAQESQNTVTIGAEKLFTFDATFGQESKQEEVFERCVKNLVLGCFAGYNATVLAYGQTGSGKTWTMGSGYTIGLEPDQFGIIPRVIRLIFDEVDKRKKKSEFIIKCSFLEIYNEELHDLLDAKSLQQALATGERNSKISIREEKNGSISLYGLHEEKVHNYEELASCLDRGSNSRTTASTLMNNNSSRSHGIFTISIEQHQIDDLYQNMDGAEQDPQVANGGATPTDEFMVAKFHFVDLAGSERAKKTGAEGATLKEGININKSLLVLGNVISALSEVGKKGNFIPYRDSKLTRILQDSLGGNSRTSMIACCSPAESNFDETLNTLNYASRARKIKNKPKVNRDPNSQLIAELRMETYNLQKECVRFRSLLVINKIEFQDNLTLPSEQELAKNEKAVMGGSAPVMPLSSAPKEFGMSGQEIRALEDEIKNLKLDKLKGEKQIQSLKVTNDSLQCQLNDQKIENIEIQQQRDGIRLQLEQMNTVLENLGHKDAVYDELKKQMQKFNKGEDGEQQDDEGNDESLVIFGNGPTILQEYQKQIQELKNDVDQKQLLVTQLQHETETLLKSGEEDQKVMEKLSLEIEQFKRNNAKLQKENIQLQNEMRHLSKGGGAKSSPGRGLTRHKSDFNKKKGPATKMLSGNTAIDSPLKFKQDEDFKHSFKRSFHMSFNTEAANEKAEVFTKDLDEKLKNFNDKFMENLTKSLTDQLFDISKNAEEQRKQTIGQSFVQQSSSNKESLIPLQFNLKNQKDGAQTGGDGKQSPLGSMNKLGALGSASVLVPGVGEHRTSNSSQASTMKGKTAGTDGDSQKLSVIQEGETETNNEISSMHDRDDARENVADDGDDYKKCPVPDNIKTSVITEEDAAEIMKKISQRNSMLQNSKHNSFADPNQPTKSMIDAQITPLASGDIKDVQVIDEGDENVKENEKTQQQQNQEDGAGNEANQDEEYNEITPVEAVYDDDLDPAVHDGDDEIKNDELIQDIQQRESAQREEHESQQKQIEGALLEKEKLLDHIKQSQKQMQTELMDMMKNQYHSKVLELTKEITKLEKEKQQTLDNPDALSQAQKKKMADQYQSKLVNLEKQLKEAKDKNKTQNLVKKQVDGQNSKIKSLEQEIQKIKVQKVTTHRKWKEETEKNNKLRKQRADELLKMKKANLKKDKEIDRLKKDAKRKEVLNKRKMEEIKVLQTQKKMQVKRASSAKKQRQEKHNIDVEKIKDWIRSSVDKMIEIADAEQEIKTQQEQLEKVQVDIDEEVSHKASVQLVKDKLLVKKYLIEGQTEEQQEQEQAQLIQLDMDLEKVDMEIEQYQQNIDSLTEKQDYILQKISEVSKEIVEIGMDFGKQIDKQNLQSPEGITATVESFFQILREASVKLRKISAEQEKQIIQNEQLKEDLQQQQNLIEANEQYYYQKIQLIEQQCQQREQLLNQLQEEMKSELEDGKHKDSVLSGNSYEHKGRDGVGHNYQLHQRMMTAKEEIQRNKNEAVHESMMFLKRRVAELEKTNNELGNQHTVINNKLKASLTEKEQMKQQISQLRSQVKLLNEMTSDLNMKNAIHSQIGMPKSAYDSTKTTGDRRQHALQERRDMIKYYKNYKRGDRDINTKINPDNADGNKGDEEGMGDDQEIKPSVIPVEEDIEDMHDLGDENEVMQSGRYHTEGHDHDMNPGSFVQSEDADDVEALPDDQHDTKNLPSFFANATERPRALTIHDTNVQNKNQGRNKLAAGPQKNTITPRSNPYNSNPAPVKKTAQVGQQRKVGSIHSSSHQQLPQNKSSRISDLKQRRADLKMTKHTSSSGMIMKASERKVGMGLHQSSSQNASAGQLGFRSGQQTKASMPMSLNVNAGKVQETIYNQSTPSKDDEFSGQVQAKDMFNEASSRNVHVGNNAFGNRSQSVQLALSPKLPSYGNWVLERNIENAHQHQIYDITSVENLLFSTSYKNLKVWDLNEMKQISDIKAHQGAIKCVVASLGSEAQDGDGATDSLFVTAGDKSDKSLHLWDMTSLTCLATLRGHKGDIRSVDFSRDGKYIFSAGQGGMLIWDLRNTDQPLELVEKKEDIFALKTTKNMMFMGCRNHSIVPMSMITGDNFAHQIQQPIVSPHWDIVTSFGLLYNDRVLISASLDHNMRAWKVPQGPDDSTELLKNLSVDKAHNAQINVVANSEDGLELYSGSRDGVVNIWALQADQGNMQDFSLVQSGQIQAQGSSVTAITSVSPSSTCHGKMVIYGGTDKVLRIYRDKEGGHDSQVLTEPPEHDEEAQ